MSSIPSQWIWTEIWKMRLDGYWQLHSCSSTQPSVPQFKVTSHMWRFGFWILRTYFGTGDGGGAGHERKHHRTGVHHSNIDHSQDIGYLISKTRCSKNTPTHCNLVGYWLGWERRQLVRKESDSTRERDRGEWWRNKRVTAQEKETGENDGGIFLCCYFPFALFLLVFHPRPFIFLRLRERYIYCSFAETIYSHNY